MGRRLSENANVTPYRLYCVTSEGLIFWGAPLPTPCGRWPPGTQLLGLVWTRGQVVPPLA